MWGTSISGLNRPRRRGAVAVLVMVLLPVLVGFAALVIDVGVLYNARADLQNAADAAALAGASALAGDEMMHVRMYGNTSDQMSGIVSLSVQRAATVSVLNPSWATTETVMGNADVTMGWLDLTSATASIVPGAAPSTYNAVQTVARRTADGANGAVELLFARIFGKSTSEVQATATAAFDDRVAGYDMTIVPGALPITVRETVFEADFETGGDRFAYDADFDSVSSGSDGLREIRLYPYENAPGNFGLLNIGSGNQGVPGLRVQIEEGVSPADYEQEVGTSLLTFQGSNGASASYSISGSPGIDASLESSLQARVGSIVGFFVHDSASDGGANTTYNITGMRYGRVVGVSLQGSESQRGFWIQPVTLASNGVILSSSASSTGGLTGRVVLARCRDQHTRVAGFSRRAAMETPA